MKKGKLTVKLNKMVSFGSHPQSPVKQPVSVEKPKPETEPKAVKAPRMDPGSSVRNRAPGMSNWW